jgi:hypothetical protein
MNVDVRAGGIRRPHAGGPVVAPAEIAAMGRVCYTA